MENILKFSKILNEFRAVERMILVNSQDRMENDIEHSYQLCMLAWYIVSSEKLDFDINLVIKYALIHDFVEVYAGDTYVYSKDKNYKKTKKIREKDAADRLSKELKEFDELHKLIDQYEKRESKESKFVYALDKIQPLLNIYLDGGKTWKKQNISLSMIMDYKKDKVKVSKEVEKYFDELITLLKDNETKLFK